MEIRDTQAADAESISMCHSLAAAYMAPFSTSSGAMPMANTAKEELTRLIQQQPEDSSREEIIRELTFHAMVVRGLADADAKRSISNEEMSRRIRSWQQ